jgi:hypothetical protein
MQTEQYRPLSGFGQNGNVFNSHILPEPFAGLWTSTVSPYRYFPLSRNSLRCALMASLMSLHLSRTAPSASTSRVYAGYSML